MINELLKTSIESRSDISDSITSSFKEVNIDAINNSWINYDFQNDYSNPRIIAVDGSINSTHLVVGDITALSSHSLYNDENKTEYVQSLNEIAFMPSCEYNFSQALNKQMNIMELKCILDGINNYAVDYVLLDGDLHSSLNHIAMGVRTSICNEENIETLQYDIITQFKQKNFSLPTVMDIQKRLNDTSKISRYDSLMYYLMIEQLCIIYHILKEHSEKIISVSKTSRSHNICNENISDRALFERFCSNSGYSVDYKNTDNRFRIHTPFDVKYNKYPVYDKYLSNLVFTNRFTKLNDIASPIKIQLAYDASESEFIEVLNILNSISLSSTGYPVMLKKVHDDVKISNKNMNNILRNMGLNNLKQERNVL